MGELWVVLATGESMSQALADSVRGRARVAVVNNCYEMAPWADLLAANDRKWWAKNPEAKAFAGRKVSAIRLDGVQQVVAPPWVDQNSNSGVLALEAIRRMGGTRVLLCGVHCRGTHYFGPYTNGLKNTRPERFAIFRKQYARWARVHPGVRVINCTPDSALECFPRGALEDHLPVRLEVAA
jgi:hypothetical protein